MGGQMRAALQLVSVTLYPVLWGFAGATAVFVVCFLLTIALELRTGGSAIVPLGLPAGFALGVWLAMSGLGCRRFHATCLALGSLGTIGSFATMRWLRPDLGGCLFLLLLAFNCVLVALAGLAGALACWNDRVATART
jgi:hypothetical protein